MDQAGTEQGQARQLTDSNGDGSPTPARGSGCARTLLLIVLSLLAIPGLVVLLGPCGVDSEFSLDTSNAFVVAFHQPFARLADMDPKRAVGTWTPATLRARLGEIGYEGIDGKWSLLWSRVIVFWPYRDASDFAAAGVLDPSVASNLANLSNRDGGAHLVAFDRWQRRTIVAHFYIELDDMGGSVLVIDPEDVPAPTTGR